MSSLTYEEFLKVLGLIDGLLAQAAYELYIDSLEEKREKGVKG